MPTDRSDKLYSEWRTSTEKFDYFVLGALGTLCAFVGQGYKASKLGANPATLELIALLGIVFAVVAGFRRIEQTLLVTSLNQRELWAREAKGNMVSKMQSSQILINEATGQIFDQGQALKRIAALEKIIRKTRPELEAAKRSSHKYYKLRNFLALAGFSLILVAKVWSAYA